MSERGRLGRASKYVSVRLRVPPDVEASGTCRSEDVSVERANMFQRGCVFLLMWSLQVRVGVRTPQPKR